MKEKISIREYLKQCLDNAKINIKFHQKIEEYLNLLIKKNSELNLISRRLTIEDIILEHIYDSLDPHLMFSNYKEITDIGTGGGLPGIPLAIVFPDKKITLIDKSPQKISFLREMKDKLKLSNVYIEGGLVSEKKIMGELITCRAFKSIVDILTFTKKNFDNGTTYILYKGKMDKIEEELKNAKTIFNFNSSIKKVAPLINKERNVVIINNS